MLHGVDRLPELLVLERMRRDSKLQRMVRTTCGVLDVPEAVSTYRSSWTPGKHCSRRAPEINGQVRAGVKIQSAGTHSALQAPEINSQVRAGVSKSSARKHSAVAYARPLMPTDSIAGDFGHQVAQKDTIPTLLTC